MLFLKSEAPSLPSRPPAPARAEGRLGITGREGRGAGLTAAGSETPRTALGAGVFRPPPNTGGRGETRGAPRPSPSPAGSNKGAPARGPTQAAPRKERMSGARQVRERAGPAGSSPGSAWLPGVTGVPVDGVAEAGAPPQRGAEERGPEDSPHQGQQPHRPRGPVWSGPAGPARFPVAARKVQSGGWWGGS